MRRLLLCMSFIAVAGSALSQTNCNIKNAHAFYSISMPGAQMADEQGNPVPPKPNISRLMYIEYSGTKAPEISAISYNNIAMHYTTVQVKKRTVFIGDRAFNPKNSITAKKGNSFIQVILQPQEGTILPDVECKSIIVKSKLGKKRCVFYISTEKEFVSAPAY